MTTLKLWKERLRVRLIQPVDNRLWRFWQDSTEPYSTYRRTDLHEIARFYPGLDLEGLRASSPASYNHVLHRFSAYAYDFDRPLHVEPRMGWLVPKPFKVIEQSFPMVNDPWDATKPRPSTLQYFTRRNVRTLERAASIRYLWSNYYHFFFDTLPQFRVLDAMGVPRDVPVLVPEYVPHVRFVREFLEMSDFLGGRPLIVQPRTEYVKVLGHTYVAKDTCYSSAVFDVVNSLKPHLCAEKTDARVFVWRDPRGSRALSNDSEIAEVAKRHGFQVVDTGRMSLREQISLFASARVVAGVHGAGLTNIIFRNRQPLTLLEIFPGDNRPEFYNHVCIQFGYEYDRVLGGPLDSRRHFYLDPTAFEAALVATTSRAFYNETEAV